MLTTEPDRTAAIRKTAIPPRASMFIYPPHSNPAIEALRCLLATRSMPCASPTVATLRAPASVPPHCDQCPQCAAPACCARTCKSAGLGASHSRRARCSGNKRTVGGGWPTQEPCCMKRLAPSPLGGEGWGEGVSLQPVRRPFDSFRGPHGKGEPPASGRACLHRQDGASQSHRPVRASRCVTTSGRPRHGITRTPLRT